MLKYKQILRNFQEFLTRSFHKLAFNFENGQCTGQWTEQCTGQWTGQWTGQCFAVLYFL